MIYSDSVSLLKVEKTEPVQYWHLKSAKQITMRLRKYDPAQGDLYKESEYFWNSLKTLALKQSLEVARQQMLSVLNLIRGSTKGVAF